MSNDDHEGPQQHVCPETHALKIYDDTTPNGLWRRGSNTAIGMLQQGNGTIKWRGRCRTCLTESSDIPTSVIEAWGLNTIEWTRVTTPNQYPTCAVHSCDQPGTDNHHFAPYNTFGSAAGDWPTAPLCRTHHLDWHQTMDGYRWHRKGIES